MGLEKISFCFEVFIAILPIIVAAATIFIEGYLKPSLIPKSEIHQVATDLIAKCEDPEYTAFSEEHAAWYRSDNFQQGKWRRVSAIVRKLRRAG